MSFFFSRRRGSGRKRGKKTSKAPYQEAAYLPLAHCSLSVTALGELAAISARASDRNRDIPEPLEGAVPFALTERATTRLLDAGASVVPEAESALPPSKLDLDGLERLEAAEAAEEELVIPVFPPSPIASVTGGLSRWNAR